MGLCVAPRTVCGAWGGVPGAAAGIAMVKKDDDVDMAQFAMPIADKIIAAASAAHGGAGDFRADKLRLELAASPISSDPNGDEMPPSMIDPLVWLAETSLKHSMSILFLDTNVLDCLEYSVREAGLRWSFCFVCVG